jgi:preprotein translocase subunit SecE
VNDLTKILIGVAVVGGFFAFLWWRGHLERFANYVLATREELRKCTWPTLEELKGSTVVVVISIIILGGFTVLADFMIVTLLGMITNAST